MALIDKASLLMVPSTYEAGTLYNVLPSGNRAPDSTDQNSGYDQTRADFTFDRGSNAAATRIGSDGLIKKYRENKLLQSNQFDTTWTNTSSTESSGFEGYDGTNNAWKIDITATYGQILQSVSISGVNCTSVYVKAGTLGFVRLRLDASPNAIVDFDLSDGSAAYTSGIVDASSESVGNGWYRISMVSNVSSSTFRIYPLIAANDLTGSSGNIYIQNAQLESGLVATDVLTSGATTAKAGVLIDLPRINYDANGENGSLLLEPSRQQLFQYSEYLNAWTTSGSPSPTLTANYAESPEGVNNAYRVEIPSVSGLALMAQLVAHTSGTKMTISAYVKSKTGTDQSFKLFGDYGTGAGTSGTLTATSEWQRFIFTFTPTATGSRNAGILNVANTAADLLVYGMQIETASYATSYIPNHGTTGGVTRAADLCTGGGSAESINSTEGVLYAEISALADDSINRHITIWDGTDTNRLVLKYDNQSNVVQVFNRVGGIETASLGHTLTDITISHKIAVRYKANDYALVIDGVEVDTDTSSSTWSASVFDNVKFSNGSGSDFYGNVKQLAVFNEALSDSELATLTTL